MAKFTGTVEFPDGVQLYFVYNGTVDMARPRLYSSEEDDAKNCDLSEAEQVRARKYRADRQAIALSE